MSLESGRKLGLISSLAIVILPAVVIPLVIAASIFSVMSRISSGSSTFNPFLTYALYAAIGIVAFASYILFLVSMRRLSKYYNEPAIFRNVLYGFLLNFVGAAVAYGVEILFFSSIFNSISSGTNTVAAVTPNPISPSIISNLFIALLGMLAIVFVFAIISAVFYMLAFNKLAAKSGVDNFKTAGLLMLLGFVLIIVGVGILLVWIAWILVAMGFHSLKPQATPSVQSASPASAITYSAQRKYCPYCGTENTTDAIYCRHCGKPLQ
jgi:uncharacterized membrane protein